MSIFSRTLRFVLIASLFMFGIYILLNIPILPDTVERPLSKTYDGPGFSELSKRMASPSDVAAPSGTQGFQICGLEKPITRDEANVFKIMRKGGRDATVVREMLKKGKGTCDILKELAHLHGR
ncbi:hypothetical protein [Cohaesibacter haloalkalitolerans]|uniref:hypothetical protein n=1 Tax=Cohaesibacter haloalkalitolerans TaxID=1162980 RepID=UPI000E6494AA|nr:hypothetical protein [Cohaesibacter haloalkalitolerans]